MPVDKVKMSQSWLKYPLVHSPSIETNSLLSVPCFFKQLTLTALNLSPVDDQPTLGIFIYTNVTRCIQQILNYDITEGQPVRKNQVSTIQLLMDNVVRTVSAIVEHHNDVSEKLFDVIDRLFGLVPIQAVVLFYLNVNNRLLNFHQVRLMSSVATEKFKTIVTNQKWPERIDQFFEKWKQEYPDPEANQLDMLEKSLVLGLDPALVTQASLKHALDQELELYRTFPVADFVKGTSFRSF